MKIKNLLMSALMLLCGAQAFAQDAEVVLYPADGTPADMGLTADAVPIY